MLLNQANYHIFVMMRSLHALQLANEVEFGLDAFGQVGRCDILFRGDYAYTVGDAGNILLLGLLFLILLLIFELHQIVLELGLMLFGLLCNLPGQFVEPGVDLPHVLRSLLVLLRRVQPLGLDLGLFYS
jgi:hypothetical protein